MWTPYQTSSQSGSATAGLVTARNAPPAGSREPPAHRGRETDDRERRAPVGDERVLEQVHEEQVVGRERLERRVDRDGDQCEPGSRRWPPGRGSDARRRASCRTSQTYAAAARRTRTRNSGSKVKRYGEPVTVTWSRSYLGGQAGLASTTLRRRSSGRRGRRAKVPRARSCSTVITSPAILWSRSGESENTRWVCAGVGRIERVQAEDQHIGDRRAHAPAAPRPPRDAGPRESRP